MPRLTSSHRASRDASRAPTSPLRRQELGLATLFFLALAFVIYGWYAFHGGFVADDWVNADHYYFHPESGFWGAVDNYQTPSRPVAAVYVTLTYLTMGIHYHQHLVLAVLLAAFLSIAFFAFLRTLGLGWVWALAAGALLLVFPSSDSTRFWTTGSQINLFIGMYLFAVVIAVYGRRRYGPDPTPRAVATQVAASTLAVAAVAGYEIVAPAVLLSFLLYRWIGKGGVLWRWLCDAIPTLLVLWFFTRKFGGGAAHGHQLFTNVRLVAEGATQVLSYTFVPVREISRWPVFFAVAAVVAVALAAAALAAGDRHRESIGRWGKPLLLSIGAIVIGYAMIVPAADRYPIYAPGVQNRTNCFAALGLCLLAVFVAAAIAAIVAAAVPRISDRSRGRLRGVIASVLISGLFVAYTVRIVEDEQRWTKSAEVQALVLAGAHQLVPSPPAEATIFTSPYPGYSAPSLPIFGGGGNNDELGAFKVSYDREDLRAFPLLEGQEICGRKTVAVSDAGNSPTVYGKAVLVDFRTSKVYRPRDRQQCLRVTKEMEPFGPVNLSDSW
jgi:hypothetical protein